MDEELARLNERLAALRKQLPDDEAVATAKRTADTQRFHVDAAVQRFKESGDRFLQRLELADSAGREFIAAKNEVVAVCAALRNLVDRYGLDIDVPTPPVRPQRDERLALNIAAALADLAAGDVPREVVEAYLAAERNERERTLTQV
jgi:hypothetical protein